MLLTKWATGPTIPVALILLGVAWPAVIILLARRVLLRIEDFPVPDALNLLVTNLRKKNGLSNSHLILHGLEYWNMERSQFQKVELQTAKGDLAKFPLDLTCDGNTLAHNKPTMFQLIQFTDQSAPFVQGRPANGASIWEMPLKQRGFYKFLMELRWAGGHQQIEKTCHWGERSLPIFSKDPQ